MLKMLIVDDEEIICNTISKTIDWKSLGIQLIGICLNGVDAYHTILDESPNIVMTDIRMPGISGLELIERISRTNLDTQFIILSGYSDFDYAKQAMKSGVRHYLLKPCDKQQIVDCIQEVIRDCAAARHRSELEQKDNLLRQMHTTLLHNVISAGAAAPSLDESFFESYERYIDFTDTPYQLCCLYYLEADYLNACLSAVARHLTPNAPQLSVYKIYVSNMLILFFPDYSEDYRTLDHFLGSLSFHGQTISMDYKRTPYANLKELLYYLIPRLKRFDVIYFADGEHLTPNYNYEQITAQICALCPRLTDESAEVRTLAFEELSAVLNSITGRNFLLQTGTQLLIALGAQTSSTELSDISDFITNLTAENSMSVIYTQLLAKCWEIIGQAEEPSAYSGFVSEIVTYLEDHIADPSLTLKWIAENHLYMNVKYVSRCFAKETGKKFSAYLTEMRMEKAKEILSGKNNERIQNVAELVGCGNNPYYFSKIFKKYTGLTPSAYIKKHQNPASSHSEHSYT